MRYIKRFAFLFWQGWLFYSSRAFALFGILFALFSGSPFFHFYRNAVAYMFWNKNEIPAGVFKFFKFAAGPITMVHIFNSTHLTYYLYCKKNLPLIFTWNDFQNYSSNSEQTI